MTDRDLLELVPLWPDAEYDLQREPLLIEFKCRFDGVFTEVLFRPEQDVWGWSFRVEVYRFGTDCDFHKFELVPCISSYLVDTVATHDLRWWSYDHVHKMIDGDNLVVPPGIRCTYVKI